MALVPELEHVRQEIDAINAQVVALCQGLGEEELAWQPDPGRWSIAENLAHLQQTTRTFLPSIDHSIEQARERKLFGKGPFGLGLMGRFYVWYVKPPVRIRLPSPPPLHPQLQGAATEALPWFLDAQQLMVERLEAANGLDLARARVTSPLASFVRMNLLAFFHVFTGHQRRHLWQATNVRRQLEAKGKPAVEA